MNFITLGNGGTAVGKLDEFLLARLHMNAGECQIRLTFGIRPEDVLLSETPREDWIKARVTRSVIAIGGQLLMTLDIKGMRLKAKIRYRESLESLEEMWVNFSEGKVLLFGRIPPVSHLTEGVTNRSGDEEGDSHGKGSQSGHSHRRYPGQACSEDTGRTAGGSAEGNPHHGGRNCGRNQRGHGQARTGRGGDGRCRK